MKKNILIAGVLLTALAMAILGIVSQLPKSIGQTPELQSFLFERPSHQRPVKGKYIYRSATELAGLIKSGQVTSVEVVKEHINHIRNQNWKFNALVWLREEAALREARQVDEKVKRGDTLQPLLGVPVTVKEQFGVKGLPMTLNARRLGVIARKDAAVVEQIRLSGAIILGTTNLSLMVSFNETFGEVYPTGNNPFDTSRTPGGSTGGGAAALAAGFTTLSLGGDAGGSVRIPAAFCGLYGFKPSFGAINVTKGVMPFEIMKGEKFGVVHAGIMARTAKDLELYWNVLKETPMDTRFQKKISWPIPEFINVNQLRMAWIDEWPCGGKKLRVGQEVKTKLGTLVQTLKEQGAALHKTAPETCEEMLSVWGGILFLITTQDETWLTRKLTQLLLKKMDNGARFFDEIFASLNDNSETRWNQLIERQKRLIEKLEHFFKIYDYLILPVTYGPAFTKCGNCAWLPTDNGENLPYIDYFPYTGMFNASGHPSVVIPMGLNEHGLPIGLQIVSKLYTDTDLLRLTCFLEPLTDGFIKPEE